MNYFRTRMMLAAALLLGGAVWLGAATLARLIACVSCGGTPNVLKAVGLLLGCAATAFVMAVIFVRLFRAEVRMVDEQREASRDRDAPPWAQQ